MYFFQESKAEFDLSRKNSNVLQLQNTRLREKIKKQSRTHALLVSIVVVFALSWFPLNILNIILEIYDIYEVSSYAKSTVLVKKKYSSRPLKGKFT